MHTLQSILLRSILGNALRSKPRRKADPDYGKFRRLAAKHAITYRLTRDGWIDVIRDGNVITYPHYNWGETLDRLERVLRGESPHE